MEFNGRITRVLPVRSGTSSRGEWKVLPFVFEFFESEEQRWSDKVLLETFDTNYMNMLSPYLQKGADGKAIVENGEYKLLSMPNVHIGFSHGVRSGKSQDGRDFTVNDLRLYRFEVLQPGSAARPVATPPQQPTVAPAQQQAAYNPQPQQQGYTENDDLPF